MESIKKIMLVKKYYSQLESDIKLVSKLLIEPNKNFSKLKLLVNKLKKEKNNVFLLPDLKADISLLIDNYINKLNTIEKDLEAEFAKEINEKLNKTGKSLSGHFPDYTSGLFTIEVDLHFQKVIIWLGYKEEKVTEIRLDIDRIVKYLNNYEKNISSRLNKEEFISKLSSIFQKLSSTDQSIPIIELLFHLAFEMQEKKFRNNPQKIMYTEYSRVNFSYDLFRYKEEFNKVFRLVKATRANANKKSDYLYVPEGKDVKGSRYSHIKKLN